MYIYILQTLDVGDTQLLAHGWHANYEPTGQRAGGSNDTQLIYGDFNVAYDGSSSRDGSDSFEYDQHS